MIWFENVARLFTSISGGGSKFHSRVVLGKVACHITAAGGVGEWYNQVEWMMLPGVLVGKVVTIR